MADVLRRIAYLFKPRWPWEHPRVFLILAIVLGAIGLVGAAFSLLAGSGSA